MQGGHHHHRCSCPLITSSLQDFHSSGGRKNRGADRGTNSDAEDGKNCNLLQEKRHQGTIFQSFCLGGWILWTSLWFEFARRSLSVEKAVGRGLVWCVPKMCWKNLEIFAKAFDLEEEVLSHLREHGDCDMGALRQAGHRVIQPTSF